MNALIKAVMKDRNNLKENIMDHQYHYIWLISNMINDLVFNCRFLHSLVGCHSSFRAFRELGEKNIGKGDSFVVSSALTVS